MSGKSIMNKFVIKNKGKFAINCAYLCLFYIILCYFDNGVVWADKEPHEIVQESFSTEDSHQNEQPSKTEETAAKSLDMGFVHAFIAAFSVIIVSELGDKTFFIAAIMAMRHPRLTVFTGAIAALALMTVLSVVFGMAANIIPHKITYWISTALFALFGLKMLKDGYYMSATEAAEELEEVQSDLRKREDELSRKMNEERNDSIKLVNLNENNVVVAEERIMNGSIKSLNILPQTHLNSEKISASTSNLQTYTAAEEKQRQRMTRSNITLNGGTINSDMDDTQNKSANMKLNNNNRFDKEATSGLIQDTETGVIRKSKSANNAFKLILRIFMQAFTMTFLAEWGDRSQLTTIILGARENAYGVILGGIIGHSICTGLAVIGGRMIAQKISVRTVTLIGGVVFLLFAISAVFFVPEE